MLLGDQKGIPYVEALKEKITITSGFENEIPIYVCLYLDKHLGDLQTAVLQGNQQQLSLHLTDFTRVLPKDTLTDPFEELFIGIFFRPEGKPHLSIVKGERTRIGGNQVQAIDLDFPDAPSDTKGLILIHTHPLTPQFSPQDKDAIAGTPNNPGLFNQRLNLFPQLQYAFIGLCTAKHSDNVLLISAKTMPLDWGGKKYFSFG